MKPTTRIPWVRVLAEGLVIVVSILLAFGIDAQWDRRQERQAEREALVGLRADLEVNRQELVQTIGFLENILADIYRLEGMSEAQLAAVPADSLPPFLSALAGIWTFDAQDGTLDALIGAGELDVLEDRRVREGLLSWKARVGDLAEEAQELRLSNSSVIRRIGTLGGPWARPGSVLAVTPELAQALTEFPDPDLTVVATDQELRTLLRTKRFRIIVYLAELIPLHDHVQALASLLAAPTHTP